MKVNGKMILKKEKEFIILILNHGKVIDMKENGEMIEREGKGIYYYNNGNRYEGDWRNSKREGKGIFYYNDGDREMGDYSNDKRIGKHVILTKNGEVKTNNY